MTHLTSSTKIAQELAKIRLPILKTNAKKIKVKNHSHYVILRNKKVLGYFGGTSQPAVLGLSKLLQRHPTAYLLRYKKPYFTSSHFLIKPHE